MSLYPTNPALEALGGEVMLLRCRDCLVMFEFNAEEQDFFRSRDYPPPIRCKACRQARKQKFRPAPLPGLRTASEKKAG